MQKIHLREDIEPQIIQNNGCTKPIRIHPIYGGVLSFEQKKFRVINGRYTRVKDDHVSLIKLDGRQWWTCYYYDVDDHGWACERENVYLRLSEREFIEQFGKITVIGNGHERYHEECERLDG